jgi:hypothetical protein
LFVCLFVCFARLGLVQAAMTTELDYGVGNISAALERTAMWHDTLLIFTSDNGGCNNATYNTQRATRSVQRTACNIQHATYSVQRTACNVQRATYSVQHIRAAADLCTGRCRVQPTVMGTRVL